MALGVEAGDAVFTTPFTFFATGGAVSRMGALTRFCDIDPVTYTMDPDKLDEAIDREKRKNPGRNLKAVVPIHLFGQCAAMDKLLAVAQQNGIPVIEDSAQAVGAEFPFAMKVKRACAMGDCGILSFFPSKNLGAFGDAGMVVTNNKKLAEKIGILRVHGESSRYHHKFIGGNFRLDSLQALVLRIKLRHLESWHEKRRMNAEYYNRAFDASGLEERELIKTPRAVYREVGIQNYHTYNQYVIRAVRRNDLKTCLQEKGIGTAIYYPLPLHIQECFAYLGYKKGDFPEAEKAAGEVLALPVYPELESAQMDHVVESIAAFYNK
jgi:dTDP-4-amino-4,6-dideoxygalactose transaminase